MLAYKSQTKSGKLSFFGRHLKCLFVLGIKESVLAHILLESSDFRSLARVIHMQIGGISGALEVVPNLFSCLIIVKSQPETTLTGTNTL